jgi:putative membrane protein
MMGWYHDGVGWGGWLLMTLMMLAFWALVIFAVVAIFRGIGTSSDAETPPSRQDAMDILQERFARGEIDAEEYDARAQVLRSQTSDRMSKTPH